MSTEKIFGGWDTMPENGYSDRVTEAWHWLAAQNVGTPQQKNNCGLTQRRAEWTMLMDLYRRTKPKTLLEIGVAQSGTAAGWCLFGEPDATLFFVDRDLNDSLPRPNEFVHPQVASGTNYPMYEQGGGIKALAKHNQKIIGINGWSTDAQVFSKLNDALAGRKIDWLWADSSHEASMFSAEFAMYWPLVADGGVYCTHDIQESSHPDVTKWREWRRLKATLDYSACFELLGPRGGDSYGIGILIR